MSFQDKLNSIVSFFDDYNSSNEDPFKVSHDEFCKLIKIQGIIDENDLKNLSYENILECLPVFTVGVKQIKPINLAKNIAKVFRGKEEIYFSTKKVESMSLVELLNNFNPNNNNIIYKKLLDLSKGKPCIIYNEDNSINTELSLILLEELIKGYNPRDKFIKEDKIYDIYKIGELPSEYVDENPLFPGNPLRPDSSCQFTNVNWKDICYQNRQIVRLLLDNNSDLRKILSNPNNIDFIGFNTIKSILEIAKSDFETFKSSLIKIHMNTAIEVNRRLKNNIPFPLLKITLKGINPSSCYDKININNGKKVN